MELERKRADIDLCFEAIGALCRWHSGTHVAAAAGAFYLYTVSRIRGESADHFKDALKALSQDCAERAIERLRGSGGEGV